MVRAKFKVSEKRQYEEGLSFEVKLSPVMDGSEENKEFFRWSPGGEIRLATINKAAADEFVVGKEYYVDFAAAITE